MSNPSPSDRKELGTPVEIARDALDTLNHAAQSVQKVYITFVLLATYIGIIIGGTTDEQLFRVSPVTLPLLNVELPILGFYALVPGLFVILHFNLLLQLTLLGQKARHFQESLMPLGRDSQLLMGEKVFGFPIARLFLGRDEEPFLRLTETLITWIVVIVGPLITLVWAQVRFLAFHDQAITWIQRTAIIIDSFLLFLFWPRIIGGRSAWHWWRERLRFGAAHVAAVKSRLMYWLRARFVRQNDKQESAGTDAAFSEKSDRFFSQGGLLVGASVSIVLTLSLLIATVPGEWWERKLLQIFDGRIMPECLISINEQRYPEKAFVLTSALFDRTTWFYKRDLVLDGAVLTQNKLDAETRNVLLDSVPEGHPEVLGKVVSLELADGRDLRNGTFQRAILTSIRAKEVKFEKALLVGAQLEGAELEKAQFQGANMVSVQLQNAKLEYGKFRAANLSHAKLRKADLKNAVLNDATLVSADLSDADLLGATLDNAKLFQAVLQEAKLNDAELVKANLKEADLRGSKLIGADLRRAKLSKAKAAQADFAGAKLNGADLKVANLQKANLVDADLIEATLKGADLQGANLKIADLRGAKLDAAKLIGANVRNADLRGATMVGASLQLADFTRADLQGVNLLDSALDGANFTHAKMQGTQLFGNRLYGTDMTYADLSYALFLNLKTGVINDEIYNSTLGLLINQVKQEEIRQVIVEQLKYMVGKETRMPDANSKMCLTNEKLELPDCIGKASLGNMQDENLIRQPEFQQFIKGWLRFSVNLACTDAKIANNIAKDIAEKNWKNQIVVWLGKSNILPEAAGEFLNAGCDAITTLPDSTLDKLRKLSASSATPLSTP